MKNWVIVRVYAPGSERSVEEREHFWQELNECLMRFDTGDRVMVMRDMNAREGDRPIERVVGPWGFLG